jgi:hypothetical protein
MMFNLLNINEKSSTSKNALPCSCNSTIVLDAGEYWCCNCGIEYSAYEEKTLNRYTKINIYYNSVDMFENLINAIFSSKTIDDQLYNRYVVYKGYSQKFLFKYIKEHDRYIFEHRYALYYRINNFKPPILTCSMHELLTCYSEWGVFFKRYGKSSPNRFYSLLKILDLYNNKIDKCYIESIKTPFKQYEKRWNEFLKTKM